MGLLNYLRNLRSGPIDGDSEAVGTIQAQHVEETPSVDWMQVVYENGVLSLSGDTESSEALKQALFMAGNAPAATNIFTDELTPPPVEANVE